MHSMELLVLLFISYKMVKEGFAKIYTMPDAGSNLKRRSFLDREADFGYNIPESGITGLLEIARPINACISILPKMSNMMEFNMIALVEESTRMHHCPFHLQSFHCWHGTNIYSCVNSLQVVLKAMYKVLHCQYAGYAAAIVYSNTNDDVLKLMTGVGPTIPSVYVTRETGLLLKSYTSTRATVHITTNPKLPLQLYLVPFTVTVAVCVFFIIVYFIFRYCRTRMRKKKSRLSPKTLKQIPTKKFIKGDEFDLCAICLEEYDSGEKIRILPCHHAYHCKCVDPWLLAGKKVCPVCKQSVEPKKEDIKKKPITDSFHYNSNNENLNHSDESGNEGVQNERTPLLSNSQYRTAISV